MSCPIEVLPPPGAQRVSDCAGNPPRGVDVAALRPIRAVLGRDDYWRLNEHRRRMEALGSPMSRQLARLIRAKLLDATVVDPDQLAPSVVTGTARVTFAIDGRRPQTRVLYHWDYADGVRNRLHVGTFLGVTLIGMTVGQRMRLVTGTDQAGALLVLAVQPDTPPRRGYPFD